ncbi:hypothetical protein, partial [Thermogutta sp.]|uniref:hypothetical protein n=1 Tax=Thermogutta sp. TaxID=1962930 RepID=UPI00322029FE
SEGSPIWPGYTKKGWSSSCSSRRYVSVLGGELPLVRKGYFPWLRTVFWKGGIFRYVSFCEKTV